VSDIRICILQRGRVVVGEFESDGVTSWSRVKRCACVRLWGTSAGLGQLAKEGPLPDTVLDPQPETEWPTLATVETIKCNPEKWESVIAEF
jgi:hypothetical protein